MSSSPTIPIPLPTDNTPTVRAYIQKVLSTSHNFSNESALHSAAEWKAGSGADLRKMRARRYRETFGNRVARILYQEVRVQVLEEEYAEREPLSRETRGRNHILVRQSDLFQTGELMFGYRRVDGCYHDHREPCDARLHLPVSTCDRVYDIRFLGVGTLHGCSFGQTHVF